MKVFGNWKSELKKKGAMALTAFMLCGSAGTVFAQSTTPITIKDTGTGDATSGVSGDGTLGNEKTVTGYQTDIAEGYAVGIEWGNMLFTYDRGTYDTSTGTLVGSFQTADENQNVGNDDTARDDIEIGGNKAQAGYWYGFDGTNNSVKIENLSTHDIKLDAKAISDGEHAGEATFSLYVNTSDNDTWSDVASCTGDVSHFAKAGDGTGNGNGDIWQIRASEGSISRVFSARKFDNYGSVNTGVSKPTDIDWIYLNITGRPDNDFMNEARYKDEGNKGEKIGTITLSFTKTDGTTLTSVNGDDQASNT